MEGYFLESHLKNAGTPMMSNVFCLSKRHLFQLYFDSSPMKKKLAARHWLGHRGREKEREDRNEAIDSITHAQYAKIYLISLIETDFDAMFLKVKIILRATQDKVSLVQK